MDELLVGMPEEIAEGTPDGLPKKTMVGSFGTTAEGIVEKFRAELLEIIRVVFQRNSRWTSWIMMNSG